jgi:hypothetical protein
VIPFSKEVLIPFNTGTSSNALYKSLTTIIRSAVIG